jgi:hypothetical protein
MNLIDTETAMTFGSIPQRLVLERADYKLGKLLDSI